MPLEIPTPVEPPPAPPPDGDLRESQNSGRWRSIPKSPPNSISPGATSKKAVENSAGTEPIADDNALPETFGTSWRLALLWRQVPRVFRRRLSPWLMSSFLHATALIALGLIVTQTIPQPVPSPGIGSTTVERLDIGNDLDTGAGLGGSALTGGGDSLSSTSDALSSSASDLPVGPAGLDLSTPTDPLSSSTATSFTSSATAVDGLLASGQQSTNWGAVVTKGSGYGGRSPAVRGKLAGQGGGSKGSEEAVERGLRWILAHQHDDGGWRFTFDGLPCNNACHNPGTESTSTGSTALALLPFLGAGYTHQQGPYQEQVSKGLYYLCNRMLMVPQGGDLQEGTMYAQGLATIVLCEAYGMTKDEKLRPYAEQAVKFVLYAQDQRGGGWRYTPGMPGDTTMTGWQMMALKSAQMAGIEVASSRFFLTGKFLDGVQSENGAAYGYRTTNKRPSTTAVGLLCRMYLGWGRTHRAVREGVQFFDKLGPSQTDMYMNYYATQFMFHHSGSPWDRWNKKMRDYLIQTQAKTGHESGSWHFDDQHGNAGGRLYTTAISILILEVYYRHLPLYSRRAVDEGF